MWCIILFIVTVMSLSACGKEESALVKQYGQEMVKYYGEEKVKEMDIKCSDEAQLQVANNLEAAASSISSYGGQKNMEQAGGGGLKNFLYYEEVVKAAEATIEIITEQHDGKGKVLGRVLRKIMRREKN